MSADLAGEVSMFRGAIEQHRPDEISGWCVQLGLPPPHQPVELLVCWGETVLRKVRTLIPRLDAGGIEIQNIGFSLKLGNLGSFLPRGTLLQVRAPDGTALPFAAPCKISSIGEAEDGGEGLRQKINAGFTVDKWGYLRLRFEAQRHRKPLYVEAMSRAIDLFHERYGMVLFPHYGTLLGLARNQAFLDHDDDVDMSFVVRRNSVEEVVNDFYFIYDDLAAQGHALLLEQTGQFSLAFKGSDLPKIDIFISWVTDQNLFGTYFGVSGHLRRPVTYVRRLLENVSVQVPEDYEDILHLTYGPMWRVPDPDFQWETTRPVQAVMAKLREVGDERWRARADRSSATWQ